MDRTQSFTSPNGRTPGERTMANRRLSSRSAPLARLCGLALAMLFFLAPDGAAARSRIKDIADFEGVRQNMLIGYGLVIGLNGTGDTINNSPFTQQSLIGML